MPRGIGVIDLMLGIPGGDGPRDYAWLRPLLRDRESRERFYFPVEYVFKDVPKRGGGSDPLKYTLEQMDRFGIERGMLGVSERDEATRLALRLHPDRFFSSCAVDPNQGVDALRRIERMRDEFGIKAVTAFPAGCTPQVPIDDKRFWPVYAKCVELGLPICVCVGVPGPRVPMACQRVERVDEVCWYFPELKFVMRHGGEPWTELAVKLMLKWPNLYYSTSAFAPKHYPQAIVDYANTRGAEKVMYAGYFPMGLSLERIFGELPEVPLRDAVWPKFLRENALRVFDL